MRQSAENARNLKHVEAEMEMKLSKKSNLAQELLNKIGKMIPAGGGVRS